MPPPSKRQSIDRLIGNRIKQRRIELGLTQVDLGAALGVTFQQVQKYEKGTNSIRVNILPLLAASLGCEFDYFLSAMSDSDTARIEPRRDEVDLDKMLKNAAGARLCRAFVQLDDEAVRNSLADLVSAIFAGKGPTRR